MRSATFLLAILSWKKNGPLNWSSSSSSWNNDMSDITVKEFYEFLSTHIVGFSWNYWNEERVENGQTALQLPVPPAPIGPLISWARDNKFLHNTSLPIGTRLYRGLSMTLWDDVIGLNDQGTILTLDRITSFTPFLEVAQWHALDESRCDVAVPVILEVTLMNRECVFADMTRFRLQDIVDDRRLQFPGDIGLEVQLLPGSYCVTKR